MAVRTRSGDTRRAVAPGERRSVREVTLLGGLGESAENQPGEQIAWAGRTYEVVAWDGAIHPEPARYVHLAPLAAPVI